MIRLVRRKDHQHWPWCVVGLLFPAMGLLSGCGMVTLEPFVRIDLPSQPLGIRSQDELARLVESYQPAPASVRQAAAVVGAKPEEISKLVELNIGWWNSQPPTITLECTAKNQRMEWAREFCKAIAPDFAAHSQSTSRGTKQPARLKNQAGWI